MLGLFASAPFEDDLLGRLVFKRGSWRGALPFAGAAIPLALFGSRREPDAEALSAARTAEASFDECRPRIADALFAHYEPYGAAGGNAQGVIPDPSAVWARVAVQSVTALKASGDVMVEFACAVEWDEDHTLGIQFVGGRFVGICGSILTC